MRAAAKTARFTLFSLVLFLLVASGSDGLGLWCVCCRRHLGHLDVLGGSISRVLGSVFLCLVFLRLFGVIFRGLFFFHLLRVFLVSGLAVVDVFLLSGLALLVWWLGAWLRVSVSVALMTLTRKAAAAEEALSAAALQLVATPKLRELLCRCRQQIQQRLG